MNKYIYRIRNYFFWILLSFLTAFGYARILLGSKPESSSWLMEIVGWWYEYAIFYLGGIIGSIIAVLYILMDIFYLNKKLKNTTHSIIIRFLIFISIFILVGVTHYILEKVVDVI